MIDVRSVLKAETHPPRAKIFEIPQTLNLKELYEKQIKERIDEVLVSKGLRKEKYNEANEMIMGLQSCDLSIKNELNRSESSNRAARQTKSSRLWSAQKSKCLKESSTLRGNGYKARTWQGGIPRTKPYPKGKTFASGPSSFKVIDPKPLEVSPVAGLMPSCCDAEHPVYWPQPLAVNVRVANALRKPVSLPLCKSLDTESEALERQPCSPKLRRETDEVLPAAERNPRFGPWHRPQSAPRFNISKFSPAPHLISDLTSHSSFPSMNNVLSSRPLTAPASRISKKDIFPVAPEAQELSSGGPLRAGAIAAARKRAVIVSAHRTASTMSPEAAARAFKSSKM